MRRRLVPAALALLSALAGSTAIAQGPAKPAAKAPVEDPCAVLTAPMVRSALGVEKSVKLEGKLGTHGSVQCTYAWDRPDKAAINERNTKRMIESSQARLEAERDGKELPAHERMERVDNEVSLTLAPTRFGSKKEAHEAFARSLKRMGRGLTVDVEGRSFTNRARYERVKGVGEVAAFSAQKGQLGFVAKERIYWIAVQAGKTPAEHRAVAVKLAKQVLATR